MRLSLVPIVVLTASTTLSTADSALAIADQVAQERTAFTEEASMYATDNTIEPDASLPFNKTQEKFIISIGDREAERLPEALATISENESILLKSPEFFQASEQTWEIKSIEILETEAIEAIPAPIPGLTNLVEAQTSEMPALSLFPEISQSLSPSEAIGDRELVQALPDSALEGEELTQATPDFPVDSPLENEIPTAPPSEAEPQVLVSEVTVEGRGLTPELEELVYNTISTQPGRTTTRGQLQEDVNAIFATGFFANVTQSPEDTPLGVRISFRVEVNPVLSRVVVRNLPQGVNEPAIAQEAIDEIFEEGYGETLNLRNLQEGIIRLNEWYQENGYDLAQVLDSPNVSDDGVVTLVIAEGIIEDVQVRFFTEDQEEVDGVTRPFIVTREMQLAPGTVFKRETAQADLQRIFGLGLFKDARLSFSPGTNPSQVIVNVDVEESNTGSIAAGAGISSSTGFFGTVSYQQRNVGGNNQQLTSELQIGEREILFDLSFTDPWIATDPNRLSYTVNAFRRQSISLIFDGGDTEIRLPNSDRPRVVRTGGGITFSRPLSPDPFTEPEWTISGGFQYQGISIQDADGDLSQFDSSGNLLSFSPGGHDVLALLQFGAVRDLRNSALEPTEGSLLRLGMDQSIPIGAGTILFNRLRASYSHYFPVDFINFTEDANAPQTLAFNLQAGTIIGDLPPYEAFSLGGANSVRGFAEGDVGSGRSYFQATAEYRFPILSFVGGALFLDYGTDLGTGNDVPGDPAGVRGKPGSGFGYGVGVRIQSPLGPIRVDYGFNDNGDSRLHFGIGQRF
ncbi:MULTISPECIES: BamA/TamA family outer membrane protein [Spirulina sp. CCY15215]|uniref:BamA/TamA family outer membrane protein n=1 Tax=Spirulina sp. CCY15215 TaxID=2767591 RepID=UPI0019503004|nr:BamA/TamA family outer membrane protein [Spirulina major]